MDVLYDKQHSKIFIADSRNNCDCMCLDNVYKEDKKETKNFDVPATYIIEEIVPGQVISIKPIHNNDGGDNYTQSMEKVKAGMKEVGLKYRIKSGETFMVSATVIEKQLYVEPLTVVNCTINVENAQNIIINRTINPII